MINNINDVSMENVDSQYIGNKAFHLSFISNLKKKLNLDCFNIVDGYSFSIHDFLEVVFFNECEHMLNDLSDINKIAKFREQIKSFIFPEKWIHKLEEIINHLEYPLIVRSSSPFEDSEKSSMAGLYLSIGDIENMETLQGVILNVWASAFYNRLDVHKPIGIIIQKYIKAEIGGVIFSKHPTKSDLYYGEVSLNGVEDVVTGKDNIAFEVALDGDNYYGPTELEPILHNLVKSVATISESMNCAIDIEWLIYENQLFILQVRPITKFFGKEKVTCFRMIDTECTEVLNEIDMVNFYHKYMKWYDKRNTLRQMCKKNNIKYPKAFYVFYNNENLDINCINKILHHSTIIKIESVHKVKTLQLPRLEAYLHQLFLNSSNDMEIVRIQEITTTEYCGNACVLENGNVYIEVMPGGFGGFLSGELDFSRYIIEKNGTILEKEILEYEEIWKFNKIIGKFLKTKLNHPLLGALHDETLNQIVKMACSTHKNFRNAKIEFEVSEGQAYFNDATFEDISLCIESINKRTLSPGNFSGALEFMSANDMDEIISQLGSRSVIAESEFLIKSKKYIANNLNFDVKEKKVLIAPYPDPVLSALIDYYDGFIFERGGLLSHLAIILREKKIPAIILPEIYSYVDKSSIVYDNGSLEFELL